MGEPIWSTGGAGGERAVVEDLDWAVRTLRAAAADVASAGAELARRRAALELDPGVGMEALASQLAATQHGRAARLEDDLEDTARRLSAVASAYVTAERAARHRIGLGTHVKEAIGDLVGGIAWMRRLANFRMPRDLPPTTATLTRDSVEYGLGTPAYDALAQALLAVLSLSAWTIFNGGATAVVGTPVAMAPARSLEEVMRRLFETQQAPGGAVRIERWTDESGATRRIVYIPGTEDWLNATSNPFDLEADVQLAAGELPAAAGLVLEALAADGARPGDPIMLAGHSLGGTVAAALAAHPQVTKHFRVTAVVTAGSPTGRIELPTSVRALHLEGTRDVVPGLDGSPNPDTPTRVTVHHDARDSQVRALQGAAREIASAHHLDTYAQTARLVDGGLTDSTDEWLRSQRAYFSTGADVTVTEYRAR